MEKRDLHGKLMSGDQETQRTSFRIMLGAGATMLTLHIAVAASAIPYVYVDYLMANCGARVILDKFESDVGTIAGLLFLASFITAFYRWYWVLPPAAPGYQDVPAEQANFRRVERDAYSHFFAF